MVRQPALPPARSWMLDCAGPLWRDLGVDREFGGFYETIEAQTLAPAGEIKRLRTVARQIYVFAELARIELAGASEVVAQGLEFLMYRHARDDGAFYAQVTRVGEPMQGGTVLYDLAFALFALARGFATTHDVALHSAAERLVTYIDKNMRHTKWGFFEHLPGPCDREQNPHMHLLEAALAWLDVSPDGCWRSLAEQLVGIASDYLFQPSFQVLSEFPQAADGSAAAVHRYEPGHHFEWIWLLDWAQRHDITVASGLALALENRVMRDGIASATGIPFGALDCQGRVLTRESRIWQVTEWTRTAALGLLGRSLADDPRPIDLLAAYLDHPVPGLWHERCESKTGRMIDELVRATSMYHVIGAMVALDDTHSRTSPPTARVN